MGRAKLDAVGAGNEAKSDTRVAAGEAVHAREEPGNLAGVIILRQHVRESGFIRLILVDLAPLGDRCLGTEEQPGDGAAAKITDCTSGDRSPGTLRGTADNRTSHSSAKLEVLLLPGSVAFFICVQLILNDCVLDFVVVMVLFDVCDLMGHHVRQLCFVVEQSHESRGDVNRSCR